MVVDVVVVVVVDVVVVGVGVEVAIQVDAEAQVEVEIVVVGLVVFHAPNDYYLDESSHILCCCQTAHECSHAV